MARMRTVKATVEYFKQQDPDTAVNEWFLRTILKSGKLKHHMAGNRYLIDLDYLETFLSNPLETNEGNQETSQYGKLRKIN